MTECPVCEDVFSDEDEDGVGDGKMGRKEREEHVRRCCEGASRGGAGATTGKRKEESFSMSFLS